MPYVPTFSFWVVAPVFKAYLPHSRFLQKSRYFWLKNINVDGFCKPDIHINHSHTTIGFHLYSAKMIHVKISTKYFTFLYFDWANVTMESISHNKYT